MNLHMAIQHKIFAKIEKELKTDTNNKNIQSGYQNGVRPCSMLITKCGKRQITEGIELPNQEKIKMLGIISTWCIQYVSRFFCIGI